MEKINELGLFENASNLFYKNTTFYIKIDNFTSKIKKYML